MPSVHEMKCPICGVENAPCAVRNGIDVYHVERQHAAYPTTYEHPDCDECRQLKDSMVHATDSYRTYGPDFYGGRAKSKSRWPKAYRLESTRLEMAANLARAEYEFHLGTVHKDAGRQHDLLENLEIIMRRGRLKP